MAALVNAIQTYAGWLYGLLGLLVLRELWVVMDTVRERANALFGLEREASMGKAMRATVTTLLLVTIAVGVYTVDHVVAPALPENTLRRAADSAAMIETPMVVAFPTDTVTAPPPTRTRRPAVIVTVTPRGPSH